MAADPFAPVTAANTSPGSIGNAPPWLRPKPLNAGPTPLGMTSGGLMGGRGLPPPPSRTPPNFNAGGADTSNDAVGGATPFHPPSFNVGGADTSNDPLAPKPLGNPAPNGAPPAPSAPAAPLGAPSGLHDGSTAQANAAFQQAIASGRLTQQQVGQWQQLQASGQLPSYEELNNPDTRAAAEAKMRMYYFNAMPGDKQGAMNAQAQFMDNVPNSSSQAVAPLGLNRNAETGGAMNGMPGTDGFGGVPAAPAAPGAPGAPTPGTPGTGGGQDIFGTGNNPDPKNQLASLIAGQNGGLPSLSTDFSTQEHEGADAAYKGASQFFDQDFNRERSALETQLSNEGFTRGSEAWNNAVGDMERRHNEARTGAAFTAQGVGHGQAGDLFLRALQARSQMAGEGDRSADRDLSRYGIDRNADLARYGIDRNSDNTRYGIDKNSDTSRYGTDTAAALALRRLGLDENSQEFGQLMQLISSSRGGVNVPNFGAPAPLDVGGANAIAANNANANANRTAANRGLFASLGASALNGIDWNSLFGG